MSMSLFRVIIAGGRDYHDYAKLTSVCDNLLGQMLKGGSIIEIVSGTANGADKLGERYAIEHNYRLQLMPANWATFGKSAGYRRNLQMAEYADALIAFWSGNTEGSGTNHMINIARNLKLPTRVIRYWEN